MEFEHWCLFGTWNLIFGILSKFIMAITIVDKFFNKDDFNRLAVHPLQSWQWGEARKEMGIEILRLAEEKKNYQISFHQIPHTPYKIGYIPRSEFPSEEVLKFLSEYAKKNNVIFIKIEPNEVKSQNNVIPNSFRDPKEILKQVQDDKLSFFIKQSSHPLFPSYTQLLDLTKTDEELLRNMKSKTRYNIRLAERKGVTVKEESNDKN